MVGREARFQVSREVQCHFLSIFLGERNVLMHDVLATPLSGQPYLLFEQRTVGQADNRLMPLPSTGYNV